MLKESGATSFQQLQNAFDSARTQDIVYFLFDLPWYDGHDLTSVPLMERRALLQSILEDAPPSMRFSDAFDAAPGELVASACKLGLEGIIGKVRDSGYTSAAVRTGSSSNAPNARSLSSADGLIRRVHARAWARCCLACTMPKASSYTRARLAAGSTRNRWRSQRQTCPTGGDEEPVPGPGAGSRCALGEADARSRGHILGMDPGRASAASRLPCPAHRQTGARHRQGRSGRPSGAGQRRATINHSGEPQGLAS